MLAIKHYFKQEWTCRSCVHKELFVIFNQKHEMGDEKNDTYEDNIKSQQDQKSNVYYCI